MNDSPQQWDDILADTLVECGHCHGPMSPLPPEAPQPRYECLRQMDSACTAVAMPAPELERYVATQMVAEMVKPAVADLLREAVHQVVETELPQHERELAELEARGNVPASEVEAKRDSLGEKRRAYQQLMDPEAFSPRWQVDWWNRRADTSSKRGLCPLFFTKIEVRSGAAPVPGAYEDERITLHWRVWGSVPEDKDLL
ncbi:zinc ribbon domain-containing protein [Streptomyces sp. CB03238]|uniref:zinc ribbon domain-containing protein n=1 Tax=Streptomyces sp. CB03238 TaxID=1907777 RepID=UPI000A0FCB3F|nr:zinc ribbon domain-containing protein [Streptomyces sp. CB03238]ORT54216.1 hypothetical protein BKD26_36100 [Streptomyces sp. CB03238]